MYSGRSPTTEAGCLMEGSGLPLKAEARSVWAERIREAAHLEPHPPIPTNERRACHLSATTGSSGLGPGEPESPRNEASARAAKAKTTNHLLTCPKDLVIKGSPFGTST